MSGKDKEHPKILSPEEQEEEDRRFLAEVRRIANEAENSRNTQQDPK